MSEFNVAAKLRIMPEGVKTNLDSIRKKVSLIVGERGKVHGVEVKPVAFGLNSLEVTLLLDDSKGGIEEIEGEIKKVAGVSEVDVLDVNRI